MFKIENKKCSEINEKISKAVAGAIRCDPLHQTAVQYKTVKGIYDHQCQDDVFG